MGIRWSRHSRRCGVQISRGRRHLENVLEEYACFYGCLRFLVDAFMLKVDRGRDQSRGGQAGEMLRCVLAADPRSLSEVSHRNLVSRVQNAEEAKARRVA